VLESASSVLPAGDVLLSPASKCMSLYRFFLAMV
jgi:hypothetical protein